MSSEIYSKMITQRRRGAEALFEVFSKSLLCASAPLRGNLRFTLFVFFACLSFSCAQQQQRLAMQELSIERDGQVIAVVNAEIAIRDEDRARGLMFRENLPDGDGMLFVFETDQILSFWMRNTIIPLTIAYITFDGRIIDIRDMFPLDETPVFSSRAARYALEVPQNWFSRTGVRLGDIVRVDLVER